MDTYFHLAQGKVRMILYFRSEFQTSTSTSVLMAPISELASTFTLSIIYAYLFSLSLEQSLDNSLTT